MEKNSKFTRWMQLICIVLTGGVIYIPMCLRGTFYLPFNEALGITDMQSGVLASVWGIAEVATFFLGGWLADRVSPGKLLSISLFMTGLGGLYLSTYPSYTMVVLIHIWWGIFNTLTFYAAMIKATRQWAAQDAQGKAFGLLEAGRGLGTAAVTAFIVAVFSWLGSDAGALKGTILVISVICIATGVLVAVFLKGSNIDVDDSDTRIGSWEHIKTALKMPVTWVISLVMIGSFVMQFSTSYIAPYATEVYGGSVVLGAVLVTMREWVKPLVAVGAGALADKWNGAKLIIIGQIGLIVAMLVFVVVPGGPSLMPVLIINVIAAYIFLSAVRALYFVLLEEGGVPMALTGTVVGIVATIGFSPDIFWPLFAGYILENYPTVQAYRIIFGVVAAFAVVGLIAAIVMTKLIAARKEQHQ